MSTVRAPQHGRPLRAFRGAPAFAIAIALAAAAALVYATVPSTAVESLVLVGLSVLSAGAIAAGIRLHGPPQPAPWLLLAACQALWAAGWVLWQWHVLRTGAAPEPGTAADALFLGGYAFQLGGLAVLLTRGRGLDAAIDTAMVAVAAGLIAWVNLIGPYVAAGDLPLLGRGTQIAYSCADVVALALLLRCLVWRARGGAAVWCVALGTTSLVAAGEIWNWLTLAGVYSAGSSFDVGWVLFAGLTGAAALHPSMARTQATQTRRAPLSWLAVTLLAAAAVTPLAMTAYERVRDGRASLVVIGGGIVLSLLVLARLVRVLREGERLADALSQAERTLRALVEGLPLVTYMDAVDDNASNLYTSPQVHEMLGYSPEDWTSDPHLLERILHPDDRERVLALVARCNATGERFLAEFRLIARDGRVVWVRDESMLVYDDAGAPLHAQGFMFDITDRKRAEAELEQLAYHDPLTGLSNRAMFERALTTALDGAGGELGVAVVYADLDDFKLVNDSFGHQVGDELLRGVGARLREAAGPTLAVGRLGGDEFSILLRAPLPSLATAATETAEAARRALARPFTLDGIEVYASASVGISLFPIDADTPQALLKHADVAMYEVKRSGRDGVRVYADSGEDPRARIAQAGRLRTAAERRELVLHYQPIVELTSGRVFSAEALIRWRDGGTLVPPADFLPLAERTGLMGGITRWVIEEAVRTQAAWLARGLAIPIAVNVPPRSVDRRFAGELFSTLERHGVPPRFLHVEVTEAGVSDGAAVRGVLADLIARGVAVAIDDFGTGHSSLSRLIELPVGTIKIDRSFVQRIDTSPEAKLLVRSIVDMARTLGRNALAEGIQTETQRAFLAGLGCRLGQGYLFGRPMEPAGIVERASFPGRLAA